MLRNVACAPVAPEDQPRDSVAVAQAAECCDQPFEAPALARCVATSQPVAPIVTAPVVSAAAAAAATVPAVAAERVQSVVHVSDQNHLALPSAAVVAPVNVAQDASDAFCCAAVGDHIQSAAPVPSATIDVPADEHIQSFEEAKVLPQQDSTDNLSDVSSVSISIGPSTGSSGSDAIEQRIEEFNEPELIAAMLPKLKGITFQQGLITSLNYNLGFSVLVFPFHMARSGWIGFATLFVASLATWLTASFIADIMLEHPTVRTYSDMGRKAASLLSNNSRRAERASLLFFRTFQMLELFMYLLFSVISIEDALLALKPDMSPVAALAITAAFIFAIAPSALSPGILARAGTLGVLAFISCFALILVNGAMGLVEGSHSAEMPFVGAEVKRFLGGYGGILLLFAGHAVYPSIFNDLEDKKDMMRVVNWTYVCMVSGCVLISLLVIFGNGPHHVEELPTGHLEENSVVNLVGQVLMIAKMVFAYGPISYPIINEVAMLVKGTTFRKVRIGGRRSLKKDPIHLPDSPPAVFFPEGPSASSTTRLVIGFAVACLAIAVAKIMPSLSFVISITGALFAVSLSLTLPSTVFIITMPSDRFWRKKVVAAALLAFGIISSCLAFYAIF